MKPIARQGGLANVKKNGRSHMGEIGKKGAKELIIEAKKNIKLCKS